DVVRHGRARILVRLLDLERDLRSADQLDHRTAGIAEPELPEPVVQEERRALLADYDEIHAAPHADPRRGARRRARSDQERGLQLETAVAVVDEDLMRARRVDRDDIEALVAVDVRNDHVD